MTKIVAVLQLKKLLFQEKITTYRSILSSTMWELKHRGAVIGILHSPHLRVTQKEMKRRRNLCKLEKFMFHPFANKNPLHKSSLNACDHAVCCCIRGTIGTRFKM